MRLIRSRAPAGALLLAALLAGCGGGSDAGDGEARSDGAPDAADTPTVVEITNDYPAQGCRVDGPEVSVYARAGAGHDWSDVGGDGTVDVVRADGEVRFRTDPGWGIDQEWVTVPDAADDPVNLFASFTELLSTGPWFFSSGFHPTDSWTEWAERAEPGEVVRVPLVPDEPEAGEAELTFDADGRLERFTYPPGDGGAPDHSAALTVVPESYDEPAPPDPDGTTVALADTPIGPWMARSVTSGRPCTEVPDPELATCIDDLVGKATVAEWLADHEPAVAAAPPECRD